jgi:hypothetical protein
MSSRDRLVEERRTRIANMLRQMESYSKHRYVKDRNEGLKPENCGFVSLFWFMAKYMEYSGVRAVLAKEYYKIHLDGLNIEERDEGEKCFRINHLILEAYYQETKLVAKKSGKR